MFNRYSCVLQVDGSDCGAAALATVAQHYKRSFGLQRLRDLAGTDRVGSNLLGLVQAAEKVGFATKAVKGCYEALAGAPLPAIAHVKNSDGLGHFVVLHRVNDKSVVIADPGSGIKKLSREEFSATWTGYLLLITPDATRPQSDVAASAPSPMRRLWGLVGQQRNVLLEAVLCAVMMTLLGLSTSYFVRYLIDSVLVHNETSMLNALGAGMVAILIFRSSFGMVRHYLLAYIGRKVDLSLMSGYARHLLSLPINFFEMRRVGDILSRFNDAGKIREAISGAALTAAVDGTVVAFTMALLWFHDTELALVATLFAPLLLVATLAHHPSARRRSRETMEQSARLSSHLVEDINGVETFKAFGVERLRVESGEGQLVRVVKSVFSLQMLSISMEAIGGLVSGLAGIVILWYGGSRVMSGAITIGQLIFFYTLLGYLLEPMQRLASLNFQIQDALVAIDRLFQVLDLPVEAMDRRAAAFEGIRDAIELKNVAFRYGFRGHVLEGLNLRIPAGATVAIVGESGCGKSTLLKLLTRFYDPTAGQVLLDGIDARDFDLASLRQNVAIVSQEPFIINATIRENVALGNPDANLQDVIAAVRTAGLEEFITRLPERYETIIGERGANLSGGERQRLAIARAIFRRPALLIFDEATSHLDTATEHAIQESLRATFAERTVLLVAHRLSTVRDADLIYVMHEGRVVEQGDHESLMAAQGKYAQLWWAQTEKRSRTSAARNPVPMLASENLHIAAVGS